MKGKELLLKRIIDVLAALIGVILLSPLLLAISLLIRFSSRGPVFFRQDRLGLHGKPFKILKFRTMVENAEQMGDGVFVRSQADSRIIGIGKFLRKTSLDEIPQLINVLKGDMSIVGPRPPVLYHPYKFEDYSDFQKERFDMRPGITGLAQISVRNSVPWEERIKYDVQYVRGYSLRLDFKILLRTVLTIFQSEQIYRDL